MTSVLPRFGGIASPGPARAAALQLIAQPIGALEVAGRPRLLSLSQHPLGLRIGDIRRAEESLQPEQGEHLLERGPHSGKLATVSLRDQLEELGERTRRVEVV